MIEARCHCGAVRIEVHVQDPPGRVTSCNCSICRRLGTLWAYYPPSQVRVAGATVSYRWGEQSIDFHHCPACGCTTHWSPVDVARDRMAVNARLMDPAVVAAAHVHDFDGASA